MTLDTTKEIRVKDLNGKISIITEGNSNVDYYEKHRSLWKANNKLIEFYYDNELVLTSESHYFTEPKEDSIVGLLALLTEMLVVPTTVMPTNNIISTANSTDELLLNGATFVGEWENVVDYTTVGVAVLGSLATDGTLYFDLSTDGGLTFTSVPSSIGDATFTVPRIINIVESHVRIRYVNGGTSMTGTFSIQTKYSNNQELGLLTSIDGVVNGETPTQVVKAIAVGADPNGDYINSPAPGVDNNNVSTVPLGIAGSWTGDWSSVDSFGEIKMAMTTDEEGVCYAELSHDGITVDTSLILPPQLDGLNYTFIHSLNPSLPYFRVRYVNGAVAQTVFKFSTILLPITGNGYISRATQPLDRFTDVAVTRQANDPTLDRNLGLINYQKSKRKFGKNNSVANSSFETIWAGADLGGVTIYVFATSAQTIRIKAGGNAADNTAGLGAQTITVEGLDDNWNEISVDITTAGASASAATTELFWAINKVFTKEVGVFGGTNTGDIIIENTTTNTELAYVPELVGSTQQCIFSVPAGKTAYVTKIKVSVGESDSADIQMFHIDNADDVSGSGGTFTSTKHYEWGIEDFSGARDFDLDTYLKFDEKNHIFFEGQRITGSGTAQISVDFEMYLVDNA